MLFPLVDNLFKLSLYQSRQDISGQYQLHNISITLESYREVLFSFELAKWLRNIYLFLWIGKGLLINITYPPEMIVGGLYTWLWCFWWARCIHLSFGVYVCVPTRDHIHLVMALPCTFWLLCSLVVLTPGRDSYICPICVPEIIYCSRAKLSSSRVASNTVSTCGQPWGLNLWCHTCRANAFTHRIIPGPLNYFWLRY